MNHPPRRKNGPWSQAVAFLHARRYSDQSVCDLFNEVLWSLREILDRNLRWSTKDRSLQIDTSELFPYHKELLKVQPFVCWCLSFDALVDPILWWTRRQVQYHRSQTLGLPRNRCPRKEYTSLQEVREVARRSYVAARGGWGHLLPYRDDDSKLDIPGIELRKRESDILALLTEHGPMNRVQLCNAIGLRPALDALRSDGHDYLDFLEQNGLVSAEGRPAVYSVTCLIHQRTRRPDGIELKHNALKKLMQGKSHLWDTSICTD
jgi:hypothetical protein